MSGMWMWMWMWMQNINPHHYLYMTVYTFVCVLKAMRYERISFPLKNLNLHDSFLIVATIIQDGHMII